MFFGVAMLILPLAALVVRTPAHHGARCPHALMQVPTVKKVSEQQLFGDQAKEQQLLAKSGNAGEQTSHSEYLTEQSGEGELPEWVWRAAVLGLTIVWASNFATTKMMYATLPSLLPSENAALRFSIAGLALAPFLARGSSAALLGGVEIGCWISLGYFGQAIGLATTSADKSAFICSLHVLWVAGVMAFLNRRFEAQTVASAIVAVVGVGILELGGASSPCIGDLWSLSQPIGFGTGYIRLEQLMRKYPDQALSVSAAKVAVVGLFALGWATAEAGGAPNLHLPEVVQNPILLMGLLWMGLGTTAFAIAIESYAFRYVPATDATIILASEPLWASLLAFVLIEEQFGGLDAVGGTLLIAACVLNELPKGRLPVWLDASWRLPGADTVDLARSKDTETKAL